MQAMFASFPAFFAQSPCSPANMVPAANAPAATSAMSLVIVEAETAAMVWSFKRVKCWSTQFVRSPGWHCCDPAFVRAHANRGQRRILHTQAPVSHLTRQSHRGARHSGKRD